MTKILFRSELFSRHYKARIRQLIGDIEGLRGLLRKREDEMGALKAN